MAVLPDILQPALDALLGRGLPAPDDAIGDASWVPDAPWSWCPRCGAGRGPLGGNGACGRRDPVWSWEPPAPGSACARCVAGASRAARAPATVTRLGEHAGPLRAWVIDVKHARWESMGERLGAELGLQLARCGVVGPNEPGAVLVPVPTPWLRMRERGIDHAEVLAAAAAGALGLEVVRPLRQRASGTQVDRSSRAGRAHAFARFAPRGGVMRGRAAVAGRHAIVIDDVRTTGATLAEVSSWLRWMGAARIDAGVVSVAS